MSVSHRLIFSLVLGLAIAPATAAPTWQQVAEARYSFLWRTITTGTLYVDPAVALPVDGDIQNPDYSKQLRIEYGIGVSRERFVNMARDALTANWPAATLDANAAEIARFYDWMQDVSKGDWYTVSWVSGSGFTLALNDRPVGAWENPEAAQIILSLWLGRAAVSAEQRDELLTQWRRWSARRPAASTQ